MPDQDTSRLKNLVNTATTDLYNHALSLLDQTIDQSLPKNFRHQLMSAAAEQYAREQIKSLGTTPNLDSQEYLDAYKQGIQNTIDTLTDSNQTLSNLLPQKTKDRLVQELETLAETQNPEQLKNLSKASFKLRSQQKPLNSQDIAAQIHGDQETLYGLNQSDTAKILEHLRSQKQVINQPTSTTIDQAINDLPSQADKLGLTPDSAMQIKTIFNQNTDLIHNYVLRSTDPLPNKLIFSPYKQTPNDKTHLQAKRLGVDPLALTYAKHGFKADDPLFSKDLQQQVKQAQSIIADPFNPQHKLSFSGHLTAAKLKPHVFTANHLYHPLYQAQQKIKSTTNTLLYHPNKLYQATDSTIKDFKSAYSEYKSKKPLGWLLAPRERAKIATNRVKVNLKRSMRYRFLKNSKRRKVYRKTKAFTNKWSPKGIKSRFTGWAIKNSAKLSIKLGTKLGIKFLVTSGLAILEAGTLVGIPLAVLQVGIAGAKFFFNKLKKQRQKDKHTSDTAGIAAKAFQAIFTGLKTLGALIGGSISGLIGSIAGALIGFAFGGPIGAVVGFVAGGLLGTTLGSLIGYNWLAVAAIPATIGSFLFGSTGILGGALTGTSTASLATTTAIAGLGGTVTAVSLLSLHQQNIVNSAFFLPETEASSLATPSFECELSDQPAPEPSNVVFSSDGRYAFPVPPIHSYGCSHWGSTNTAADIFVATSANDQVVGNPIVAYTSGTIAHVELDHEFAGINFSIRGNDGRTYYYSHNCAVYVNSGDSVSAGQVVATTNKTGINAEITPEHLHFEIYQGGQPVCAQTDFEEKFQLNKCSPAEQCAPTSQ